MNILGISAYYHDSAATLLQNGNVVAAAQEERFSRKKHDAGFPVNAVRYCLSEASLSLGDINYVVYYDKPLVKFERLLETYLAYSPKGIKSFLKSMPIWLKEKLFLKTLLRKELAEIGNCKTSEIAPLLFTAHHQSHAAAAYYPSPFEEAAVLCLDGVGEWATTSAWHGSGNQLTPLWQLDFPHSLGLLYSAFTYYAGFRVNSGEYKLMGLAPYGEPVYADKIRDNLIDVKLDGTFRLNMEYFDYPVGLKMTSEKFHRLFDSPPRQPESKIGEREMNLARSIQVVTEDIVCRLTSNLVNELGVRNVCLAGGVALNCVANGQLLNRKVVDHLWIQPAAGDAGGALGAAFSVWHEYLEKPRDITTPDKMQGAYLGPEFSNQSISQFLEDNDVSFSRFESQSLTQKVAELLNQGNVIGWFQHKMEFGPRALGNRSIIADPRDPKMQKKLNLKIKYRESFRPFAPMILEEKLSDWFELEQSSPYMTLVADVLSDKRTDHASNVNNGEHGIEQLENIRSKVPAVTHVDYSARVQTVSKTTNPLMHSLITEFERLTDCPVLINTSFNVRGEPIVCSPEDAFRCFLNTEMDYLVMGEFVLDKSSQSETNKSKFSQIEREMD